LFETAAEIQIICSLSVFLFDGIDLMILII